MPRCIHLTWNYNWYILFLAINYKLLNCTVHLLPTHFRFKLVNINCKTLFKILFTPVLWFKICTKHIIIKIYLGVCVWCIVACKMFSLCWAQYMYVHIIYSLVVITHRIWYSITQALFQVIFVKISYQKILTTNLPPIFKWGIGSISEISACHWVYKIIVNE